MKREIPADYNERLRSAEFLKSRADVEIDLLNYLIEFLSNMKSPADVAIQKSGSQEGH